VSGGGRPAAAPPPAEAAGAEHAGLSKAAGVSDAATDGPSPALRPEPFVSLVIPVFNEEEVLPLLLSRLEAIGQELPGGFEAVFVDDGSRDGSARILAEANGRDPRVKLVQLSRNFGQAAAMTAGLDHVRGEVVVLMDADLQDPPELVPRMVRLYREGFEVVHARRASRRTETWFKRWTAWLFYRLMGFATAGGLRADVGEFRLMSREVTEALGSLREQHRLLRGLVAWVGFRQTTLDFERPGRAAGLTKFPVRRMLELSLDAITSFSAAPLRLATLLGLIGLAVGLGYAAYAVWIGYIRGLGVPGWTSLVILNIFFSGVVLICLGLIGEYVGRIFEEVKGRPLYVVRRRLGTSPRDRAAE
jgi:glycosyltransferase involved in cell wall biosynthesis